MRSLFNFLRASFDRWRSTWQTLLESEQHFQLLVDGATDYAIFMLNPDGTIRSWSSAAEKIFGYTRKEIRGRHFSCFYSPQAQTQNQAQEELHMAVSHGRFEDTGWRVRKDGSQFWANSVICPVLSREGNLQGFSNVTRDISERRQAEILLRQKEEELHQARKLEAIGRLAGGIAHDFNNLMTGIIGLSEDLCSQLTPDDPKRGDFEEILKAAYRATGLTRQLLALGRRQPATPKVLKLNAVISDLEKIIHRLVGEDVELILALASETPVIKADPAQVEQILINLIMNARDAMPKGGRITLKTQRLTLDEDNASKQELSAGAYGMLLIEDTGIGMSEETLAKVFEPFFTTKPQSKGTGLGLATVYGIVKQNGGHIRVRSRPDHGTTFEILLPEVQEETPSIIKPVFEASGSRQTATIMVVEDEEIVRHAVSRALQRAGYRILIAASPEEAMEICRREGDTIDLLLTDVIMPGLNGRDLSVWVKGQFPKIAVLYMSGYSEDVITHRGLVEPGVQLIEKSFTREVLIRKVEQVLEAHRQQLKSLSQKRAAS